MKGQAELLKEFIAEYPRADVTELRELQAETNVAAGAVLGASDEVPLEQYEAVAKCSERFNNELQIAKSDQQALQEAAAVLSDLESSQPAFEELVKKSNKLAVAGEQFKGKFVNEKGILSAQNKTLGKLKEISSQAKEVLGESNDDVTNFEIQLASLTNISEKCQQLGREDVSRLNEIKELDDVFNAQSKTVSELVEKIQNEPRMQGARARANTNSDSGNDSAPEGLGL